MLDLLSTAIFSIALPLGLYLLAVAARELRRCDCRAAAEKAAEEARLEAEKRCIERMRVECGLSREAQLILEKLVNGELVLLCPDGTPAQVIGGEVVCSRAPGSTGS